jgi:hypothetical protein
LPAFPENAIGFNAAAYLQSNSFLGIEMRAATYPVSARFDQSPVTVGVRGQLIHRELSPIFFVGGGMSYANDIKGRHVDSSAWCPAWQASIGLDKRYGSFSWRVGEVSWIDAYTTERTLRTITVGTGVVMRFFPR